MSVFRAYRHQPRSPGEEVANGVSHGIGLLAAIVAVPMLLAAAIRHGNSVATGSVAIFGASVVLVFLASTLYHALPPGRAKRVFEVIDNAAVFLMIAGTYTPFTLVLMRGAWGWSLFAAVWSLAAVGIILTMAGGLRYPILSVSLCLVMGWLFLIAVPPLTRLLPAPALRLILWGGVAYTTGLAFYAARRLRYHHLIWHLLVLVGASCHFLAVFRYMT